MAAGTLYPFEYFSKAHEKFHFHRKHKFDDPSTPYYRVWVYPHSKISNHKIFYYTVRFPRAISSDHTKLYHVFTQDLNTICSEENNKVVEKWLLTLNRTRFKHQFGTKCVGTIFTLLESKRVALH